jgi:hypothetical protein
MNAPHMSANMFHAEIFPKASPKQNQFSMINPANATILIFPRYSKRLE